jgi:hypothetical protein
MNFLIKVRKAGEIHGGLQLGDDLVTRRSLSERRIVGCLCNSAEHFHCDLHYTSKLVKIVLVTMPSILLKDFNLKDIMALQLLF